MKYFESHSFTVSIMGVIPFLPSFLNTSWFPQYFLYVLNEILSLLGPLYLSTIVSVKSSLPASFENLSLFVHSPTIQKFASPTS